MRLNNHFFLLLFIFSFYFINNSYCTIYYLSNSGSDVFPARILRPRVFIRGTIASAHHVDHAMCTLGIAAN